MWNGEGSRMAGEARERNVWIAFGEGEEDVF